MTGMEAFDLFRSHISPMEHEEFNTKEYSEAFILLYIAAKEMDMREKLNEEKKITGSRTIKGTD